MPAIKNRIGLKYGRLTVIERAENIQTGGRSRVAWKCKCTCGNEIITTGDNLQNGSTKSCGCLNTETRQQLGHSHKRSLIGQIFGKLTVLEECDEVIRIGKTGYVHFYLCQCDCGNIVKVRDYNLRSGNTQSCGCDKMSHGERKIGQLLKENNISFVREKTFESCRFTDTHALARFDFYVDNKYLIEFDGAQHFSPHNFGATKEDQIHMFQTIQNHDNYKNNWCIENNITLIRIPFTHLKTLSINDLIPQTSNFIIQET